MSMSQVAPKRRPGQGGLLVLLLVLLPLGLFVLPTSVLLMVGLLPTVVAWIVDRDSEKSAALTVGAMNLCGIAPYVILLWQGGHSMERAMRFLADPSTWLVMYGAAAVGWVIYFLVPQVVAAGIAMRNESRIRTLEAQRATLVAEWGTAILGKDADAAEPQGLLESPGGADAPAAQPGPVQTTPAPATRPPADRDGVRPDAAPAPRP